MEEKQNTKYKQFEFDTSKKTEIHSNFYLGGRTFQTNITFKTCVVIPLVLSYYIFHPSFMIIYNYGSIRICVKVLTKVIPK